MKPIIISLIAITLFGSIIWAILSYQPPKVTPQAKAQEVTLSSDGLWKTIQEWRVRQNLKPYVLSNKLCVIADKRIKEIEIEATHDKFHYDYKNYPVQISENIAAMTHSDKDTLEGWLSSPAHAAALRKNYPNSCVRTSGWFAVQIFSY